MITTRKMILGLSVGTLAAGMLLPMSVFAATVSASVATVITASDQAITLRIAALNALNSEVTAMKNVSAAEKTATSANVQTQIDGLTALKAKIDADTDLSTVRTDAQSILTSFRIYALVIPQGYLLAGADRVNTIGTLIIALATKLSEREAQATIAGGSNQTSAPATLLDITKKISDADAHATLATNAILYLVPDNGNGTIASNNKGTLLAARANMAIATGDLKAAREDISMILKNLNIPVSTSTSTSTQ